MGSRLHILTTALAAIETRLAEELTPQEVADICYYSLNGLQKLFSNVFHMGIADYITHRRMTLAAHDLLATRDSVLEIALRCGYNSPEVFTRAFRRIWGETPSRFRRTRSFSEIFPPKMIFQGEYSMITENADNARLYDAIRELDGTWAVVFDVTNLMPINEQYGMAAGDLAIAECVRRIEQEKQENMLLFRLGGDEFILLTGLSEESAAEQLAETVLTHNGGTIMSNGNALSVSMHHAITRLDDEEQQDHGLRFRRMVGSAEES